MRKILIILLLAIVTITLTFLTLRVMWASRERTDLNVYILNKSVIHPEEAEHKSVVWLLNHYRFTHPERGAYSYRHDYHGFFPIDPKNELFDFRSVRISEVEHYASTLDVAYYVDCYGVYPFEWYKGKSKPTRTQRVYGGLNQNDYLLMKKMLDRGKLVIAEYSLFGSPTNALVRSKTEALLGVKWLGWTGRYFHSFDVSSPNGPPGWMKNLYESQHLGVWPSGGSGIILLNHDGILEVLELGKHIKSRYPEINVTENATSRFGVRQNMPFVQWFEFINPGLNHVPATFTIDVTESGRAVLEGIGLSPSFPAVIEHSGDERFFYFCGNFASNPVQMWTASLAHGKRINNFLYRFRAPQGSRFLNDFYFPLLGGIIKEYANEMGEVQ